MHTRAPAPARTVRVSLRQHPAVIAVHVLVADLAEACVDGIGQARHAKSYIHGTHAPLTCRRHGLGCLHEDRCIHLAVPVVPVQRSTAHNDAQHRKAHSSTEATVGSHALAWSSRRQRGTQRCQHTRTMSSIPSEGCARRPTRHRRTASQAAVRASFHRPRVAPERVCPRAACLCVCLSVRT
jgi:hypothetical protein